jgi:hypothetical protein
MPHTRSPEAEARRAQRKVAREFKYKFSYNDFLISELIDRTDPADVVAHLETVFGFADMSAVPCTFKGVVLSDAYGRGAFQLEMPKK